MRKDLQCRPIILPMFSAQNISLCGDDVSLQKYLVSGS